MAAVGGMTPDGCFDLTTASGRYCEAKFRQKPPIITLGGSQGLCVNVYTEFPV